MQNRTSWRALAALLAVLWLLTACGKSPSVAPPKAALAASPYLANTYAMTADAVYAKDQVFTGAGLAGRPWVLHHWASWCPPCRDEWPRLASLAKAGVVIVGVNTMDDPDKAADWIAKAGNPFHHNLIDHIDTADARATPPGIGLPETRLYSASGQLLKEWKGALSEEAATTIEQRSMEPSQR